MARLEIAISKLDASGLLNLEYNSGPTILFSTGNHVCDEAEAIVSSTPHIPSPVSLHSACWWGITISFPVPSFVYPFPARLPVILLYCCLCGLTTGTSTSNAMQDSFFASASVWLSVPSQITLACTFIATTTVHHDRSRTTFDLNVIGSSYFHGLGGHSWHGARAGVVMRQPRQ